MQSRYLCSDHFVYTYHTPYARGVPDYYGIVVYPNKTCLRKYFYLENLATKTFWARRMGYENALFPLLRAISILYIIIISCLRFRSVAYADDRCDVMDLI